MMKKRMDGGIDVAAAILKKDLCNMVSNYKSLRTGGGKASESEYTWFSVRALQDFFKSNGMQLTYAAGDTINLSGLRIYFGVHPANDLLFPNCTTTILVPTQQSPTNGTIQHDYYDGSKKTFALFPGISDPDPNVIYDYATLCPPKPTHATTDIAAVIYDQNSNCNGI